MKKILLLILIGLTSHFSFSQCNNLFISEYVEGSSFNKSIEIYNPTGVNIPGNAFAVRIYFNGSTTPTTIIITGTINANSTYVLSHSSASPAILALSNQTNAGVNFNGDDAVELFAVFNSTSVDVIGVIGVDPGTEWNLNGTPSTLNHTIIRKPTVQQGNVVWTGSGETEWNVMANDDIANLGAHTMNPCGFVPPTADFTNTQVCLGFATSFTDLSTGGQPPYTYFWNFGDASPIDNTQNPTHTYATAGTFQCTLIVVDQNLMSDTLVKPVIVFSSPVPCVNPTPNTGNGCAPDTVEFLNCSSGSMPLTYSWTFSNGNTSTAIEPIEIFNADTAWLDLTVTDANGCVANYTDGTDINLPDDASFNYSSNSYCATDANQLPTITGLSGGTFGCSTCTVNSSTGELDIVASGTGTHTITYTTNGPCPTTSMVNVTITNQLDATITPVSSMCSNCPGPITLTAVDAGGTWSGTGITNATTGTFDCAVANIGTNTIIYTINGGCGDADTIQITIIAQDFLNIYNSDTTICNDIFGFFLSAENGGNWSGVNVSDNADGTGFFSSAAITAGTYYAVYSTTSACPFEDSIQIDVFDYPIANFTFLTGTPVGTVDFTDASTGATTWSWDFDDGSALNTTQNPSHTYTANGTYNVCLNITNAAGCTSSHCETVVVTGVGINEIANLKLNIYPNPSKGNFTIQSNSNITKISVKDLIGKNVYSKNVNGNNAYISLEEMNNGFYFIEIETENGKVVKRVEIVK